MLGEKVLERALRAVCKVGNRFPPVPSPAEPFIWAACGQEE